MNINLRTPTIHPYRASILKAFGGTQMSFTLNEIAEFAQLPVDEVFVGQLNLLVKDRILVASSVDYGDTFFSINTAYNR